MKKLIYSTLVFLVWQAVQAQISEHAIGLRFGGSNGLGTEVTYQHGLNEENRLQLDLGLRQNEGPSAFKLSGTYQWVEQLEGNFYWFYGFGAGVGFVDYDGSVDPLLVEGFGNTLVTVEGIAGIEYDLLPEFEIPLQIALDVNPNINLFNDYYNDLDFDVALSIRWKF